MNKRRCGFLIADNDGQWNLPLSGNFTIDDSVTTSSALAVKAKLIGGYHMCGIWVFTKAKLVTSVVAEKRRLLKEIWKIEQPPEQKLTVLLNQTFYEINKDLEVCKSYTSPVKQPTVAPRVLVTAIGYFQCLFFCSRNNFKTITYSRARSLLSEKLKMRPSEDVDVKLVVRDLSSQKVLGCANLECEGDLVYEKCTSIGSVMQGANDWYIELEGFHNVLAPSAWWIDADSCNEKCGADDGDKVTLEFKAPFRIAGMLTCESSTLGDLLHKMADDRLSILALRLSHVCRQAEALPSFAKIPSSSVFKHPKVTARSLRRLSSGCGKGHWVAHWQSENADLCPCDYEIDDFTESMQFPFSVSPHSTMSNQDDDTKTEELKCKKAVSNEWLPYRLKMTLAILLFTTSATALLFRMGKL